MSSVDSIAFPDKQVLQVYDETTAVAFNPGVDSFELTSSLSGFGADNGNFKAVSRSVSLRLGQSHSLALEGQYDEARDLVLAGLSLSDSVVVKVAYLEELTWLTLFFEDWEGLGEAAVELLSWQDNNPSGLYAQALLAFRFRDYQASANELTILNQAPASLWTFLGKKLCVRLVEKAPDQAFVCQDLFTTHDFFPWADLTTNNLAALSSYDNYLTMIQGPLAEEFFFPYKIRNIQDLTACTKDLLASASLNIPRQANPEWLVHLYFKSFMNFDTDPLNSRTLDEAIANGFYDCTEYAYALHRVLDSCGIRSRLISYDVTEGKRHMFVAFERDGLWGFASPFNYQEATFTNLEEVCAQWRWDSTNGLFVHWEKIKDEDQEAIEIISL